MPDDFGFIIDGWTHGTEHYLAVYGCYETTDGRPKHPLLSLSPVMDEPDDHLNADGHMMVISRFLPFFGKSLDDSRFLVGDNCAVNKRLANLLRVPLIGCASLRLNFAVREYLKPYESSLEEVQWLMRKLRTVKQAAQLRTKTPLAPVLRQDTRLPSTFSMLERYFRLRELFSADEEDIGDFLPSRATHRKLATLLASLRDVKSVSKRLQADGLALLDVRDLFDALIEIRPAFANYLGKAMFLAPDADIIHSVAFEKATVKVLAGQAAMLTEEEATALGPFKRESTNVAAAAPSSSSKEGFAGRVLKRRKVSAEHASYILLHAIPPSSNIMERLFSIARAVLRHEHQRLAPMMLEMIMFLKMNSSYYDVATVEQCV
ncbi:hypothetical protein PC121_g15902 [Phytophthora cactorum]|nr:hypothetical protein PC120_g14666 [Phytophthora cactorum]KAG3055197.1 hypothetical protein PC121_g15902 [Phytophthora cactorum]